MKHIGSLCGTLTGKGIITCNVEYRRVGDPGGSWPGTFLDVLSAVDLIPNIVFKEMNVDADRIAALGHSAGGHLALWLSLRNHVPTTSPIHQGGRQNLSSVCSLAGVCDLRTAWKQRLGNGAVARLMDGAPEDHPDRYDAGSPIELLPTYTKQVLVHGTEDNVVPISQSETFAERAGQLGGSPQLKRLANVDHFDLIDPESEAGQVVVRTVLSMMQV